MTRWKPIAYKAPIPDGKPAQFAPITKNWRIHSSQRSSFSIIPVLSGSKLFHWGFEIISDCTYSYD
jgi:hypothetical protein